MSGKKFITLGAGVKEAFKEISGASATPGFKFLVYKVQGENEIVLEWKDTTGQLAWDQFTKKLPQNEGRYAIVDFVYIRESDKVKLNKLIFVSWCPSASKVKDRMFYGMYAQEVKTQVADGQAIETLVQATDVDEVSFDVVVDIIKRHTTAK